MLDAKILPFPRGGFRAVSGSPAVAHASARALEQVVPWAGAGRPFAVLSLKVRRIAHPSASTGASPGDRIRSRCTQAVLETLAPQEARVVLGGTREHPVIGASFEGDGATFSAATAALEAAHAVRDVQRVGERSFTLSGGLGLGRALVRAGHVRVAFGSATAISERLRERAAPGQLLLGGGAWREHGWQLEMVAVPDLVLSPDEGPEPVWVLRGLRPRTRG